MTVAPIEPATPPVSVARAALFAQILGVMGLKHSSFLSRCLYPLFYLPLTRMSRLWVETDQNIAALGWNAAVRQFASHLVKRIQLHGENSIPTTGSMMMVSNHPAAYDVAILAAAIHRDDLKILASDISFIQIFPHIYEHSIPVYYDLSRRLETVRRAIRHLEQGGALLIFPRGNVEPDPAVSPGAIESLAGWSPSVELFLRRVPQTTTSIAIASGMLSAGWYKSPMVQMWKKYEQRQKVAEIFQVASQLVTGKTPAAIPTIYFSAPLTITDLGGGEVPQGALLQSLLQRAGNMLDTLPIRMA